MAKKFVVTKMNGEVAVLETTKEVQTLLQQEYAYSTTQRALLKDIADNKLEWVQHVTEEEAKALVEPKAEETPETPEDQADAPEEQEPSNEDTEPQAQPEPPVDPSNDVEYPEVGFFKDEKAFKKYIKKVPDANVQEWCELEGVEWTPNDHEAINRMRMIMALKVKHFPQLAPAPKKAKSKYSEYTTEALVQMAIDNDIYVEGDNGNVRILRMKTIMALRDAKIIE